MVELRTRNWEMTRMKHIINWTWDVTKLSVRVNVQSLIWQVQGVMWCVVTPKDVFPTPSCKSYPWFLIYAYILHIVFNYIAHPSLSHPQLHTHRRTHSLVIPHYLYIQSSWVDTEYSIHWVQHTPNTVYTEYSIHRVQHTPSTAYTEYSIHRVEHTPSTAYSKYTIHRVQHIPSTAYTEYSIYRVQHTPNTACIM